MIQFGIIEVLYFLGETTGKYRMSSITVSVSKSFHVCCTCSFKVGIHAYLLLFSLAWSLE